MTFTEIVSDISDRLGLTSSTDIARVGRAVNRFYKEITSEFGIKHTSRRTTVSATCTMGVSTLQFTSAEKVVAVYNRSVTPYFQLEEVTVDELRREMPFTASDNPTRYAVQSMASDSVTILLNCSPQTAFDLYADVYATTATLSGTDEPAFPESYHNALIDGPLIDEYLKIEKPLLSAASEKRYQERLGKLRHWIAVSTTKKQYQGKDKETAFGVGFGSSGGSGSSFNGAQSWTQTGLVTFDRDPSAPFAVTASSAVVPNLDADKLDGLDAVDFFREDVAAAGSLLFVDATHDIGASGATRPRDLFLSRNATIGGTLGVTGAATFTAQSVHNAGINIAGASAGQIVFPATQNASINANTLDDYEEAAWTPVLVSSGGGAGTYTTQLGRYIKVGKLVRFWCRLTLATKGTLSAGTLTITGLPAADATTNLFGATSIPFFGSMSTSVVMLGAYVQTTSAAIVLQHLAAAATATTSTTLADINTTFDVIIGGAYQASS